MRKLLTKALHIIFFAALPIIPAALYVFGIAHHQGYLAAFGIEDSLFPLAFERVLLSGFVALTKVSARPLAIIYILVITLPFACYLVALAISKRKSPENKVESEKDISEEKVEKVWAISQNIFICAHSIFVILFVFFYIFSKSRVFGEELGKQQIRNFLAHKGDYVQIYSNELLTVEKAIQIGCGSSHCAFWQGDKAIILPHKAINRIVA